MRSEINDAAPVTAADLVGLLIGMTRRQCIVTLEEDADPSLLRVQVATPARRQTFVDAPWRAIERAAKWVNGEREQL